MERALPGYRPMTRNRNSVSGLTYRNLEQRRLLAADFGLSMDLDMVQFSASEPCVCDISDLMTEAPVIDLGNIEAPSENHLDLTDGSDGVFGELNKDNPLEQLTFTAPDNGTANIILSSSLGDANTDVKVYDSSGELVLASSVEDLDGFNKISFHVDQGETYEIHVSSNDGAEGQFQLTVQFEADAPVDSHEDTIGEDATEIDMSQGAATVSSGLEHDGDVDAFQFTAAQDGEVRLFAGEMTSANTQLEINVYDADGNVIAAGSTNEFVEASFDVEAGKTYYVTVNAGEGQTGEYNLALHQDVIPVPVDQHANETGPEATLLDSVEGLIQIESALETAEDTDAFRFVAEQDGIVTLTAISFPQTIDFVSTDPEADQPLDEAPNSDLRVSVFDSEGNLLVDGLANESMGLSFETVKGNEYHVLIDSENDTPTEYYFDIQQNQDDQSDESDAADWDSAIVEFESNVFTTEYDSLDDFFSGMCDFNFGDGNPIAGNAFGFDLFETPNQA